MLTPLATTKPTERLQDLYHLRRLVDAEIANEEARLRERFHAAGEQAAQEQRSRNAVRLNEQRRMK